MEKVELKKDDLTKKLDTGYSYWTLFLGPVYAFFHGGFGDVFWQIVFFSFTGGLSQLCYFPFFFNKGRIKRHLVDGWEPNNEESRKYLKGISLI